MFYAPPKQKELQERPISCLLHQVNFPYIILISDLLWVNVSPGSMGVWWLREQVQTLAYRSCWPGNRPRWPYRHHQKRSGWERGIQYPRAECPTASANFEEDNQRKVEKIQFFERLLKEREVRCKSSWEKRATIAILNSGSAEIF